MPGQPTQEDIDKLQKELDKALEKIKKLEDQLKKEPKSDGKNSVAKIIAAKLQMLNEAQKFLSPAGLATLDVDTLKDFRKKIRKNLGPQGIGGIIVALFKTLIGIVKDILEGVWDILKELALSVPAVFEESDGDADIDGDDDSTSLKLEGKTDNLKLRFSDPLQQHGFPVESGSYAGNWNAALIFRGVDAERNKLYLVTDYEYIASGVIEIGPVKLRGLRQVLDVEEDSIFTVSEAGEVSGLLFTRFLSDNWPDDERGIPSISEITGTIIGKRLFYHSSAEDFCWVSSLLPNVPSAEIGKTHIGG